VISRKETKNFLNNKKVEKFYKRKIVFFASIGILFLKEIPVSKRGCGENKKKGGWLKKFFKNKNTRESLRSGKYK